MSAITHRALEGFMIKVLGELAVEVQSEESDEDSKLEHCNRGLNQLSTPDRGIVQRTGEIFALHIGFSPLPQIYAREKLTAQLNGPTEKAKNADLFKFFSWLALSQRSGRQTSGSSKLRGSRIVP